MDVTHVFIDTSVYLKFYTFSNADIEELKKISALISAGKLKLYVPTLVVDEFYRNRESRLKHAMQLFKGSGPSNSVPRFIHGYDQYKEFKELTKKWNELRDRLADEAEKAALDRAFPADKLFEQIVKVATSIEPSDAVIEKAERRRVLGNPPGKKDSLGDQLNWEMLLDAVPDGETLFVVVDDKDYASLLRADRPRDVLAMEWEERKSGGTLTLFSELKPFLAAKFPHIKLAADVEKSVAIDGLLYSGTFAQTHEAIRKITPMLDNLDNADAVRLIDAGLNNTQICWIASDADVNAFFLELRKRFEPHLDNELLERLDEKYFPEECSELDDIPF